MRKRAKILSVLTLMLVLALLPSTALAAEGGGTAYASTQSVEVDGKAVQFQMYALKDANGNPTNYVKLRDLALILNGTAAQFEVGWDGHVNIETGKAYTSNGSEMQTPYTGDRAYRDSTAGTNVNGAPAELSAIVLTDDKGGDYTYYQLRDLGGALGFKVDWSKERGVFIETATATEPTKPATPTVSYYKEYPDIPDFGACFGVPAYDVFIDDEGGDGYERGVIYIYDAGKVDALIGQGTDVIEDYSALLEKSGYAYSGSFTDSDGYDILVYQKTNRSVQVGLSLLGGQTRFAVYVFDEKEAPVAGTVTFYKEYPDLPDFGAYFGISAADVFVDTEGGTNYKKAVMYIYNAYDVARLANQGVDVIDGYDALLEANGYRYVLGFDNSDGYTTLVYEKGNRSVQVGLSELGGQTRFTVTLFEE